MKLKYSPTKSTKVVESLYRQERNMYNGIRFQWGVDSNDALLRVDFLTPNLHVRIYSQEYANMAMFKGPEETVSTGAN